MTAKKWRTKQEYLVFALRNEEKKVKEFERGISKTEE